MYDNFGLSTVRIPKQFANQEVPDPATAAPQADDGKRPSS
jgi:hypothetical protein